jgi:hypothetical protein
MIDLNKIVKNFSNIQSNNSLGANDENLYLNEKLQ